MYKKAFLISLLLGVLWGLTIVYIVIEHNPQMAVFKESRGNDIKYLFWLFISWSFLVGFGVFACLGVIIWTVKAFKK